METASGDSEWRQRVETAACGNGRGLTGGRAVHINGATVHDDSSIPHGGVKSSGFGRFNGTWGIEEFTTVKTITFRT